MEEMKCPEPKVNDRNETPKTSAARKRPGSWLQGNALPFRASNGLNDITQGAASLCPGL